MKLLFLVSDKNMEFLLRGLLPRISKIENLPDFEYKIFIHPERDPGVLHMSAEFLRSFQNEFNYAIVILDHEGCGCENEDREYLETKIESDLNRSGWIERNAAIAIDPELENWIWVNSVRIQDAISWNDINGIYDWLSLQGFLEEGKLKPSRPKEAFEAALRYCNTPRSSAIYFEIASKASYSNCQDPSFKKLISKMRTMICNHNISE